MSTFASYAKVKSHQKTVFVNCNPLETIEQIKNKYAEIVDATPAELKLLNKDAGDLDEKSTVQSLQYESGFVLYAVRKVNGEWEKPATQ